MASSHLSRRALMRALTVTAGAAALPLLAACGAPAAPTPAPAKPAAPPAAAATTAAPAAAATTAPAAAATTAPAAATAVPAAQPTAAAAAAAAGAAKVAGNVLIMGRGSEIQPVWTPLRSAAGEVQVFDLIYNRLLAPNEKW